MLNLPAKEESAMELVSNGGDPNVVERGSQVFVDTPAGRKLFGTVHEVPQLGRDIILRDAWEIMTVPGQTEQGVLTQVGQFAPINMANGPLPIYKTRVDGWFWAEELPGWEIQKQNLANVVGMYAKMRRIREEQISRERAGVVVPPPGFDPQKV